jgi:fumarylacetoacetase
VTAAKHGGEVNVALTGSWVESANGHPDFSLLNLPFGLVRHRTDDPSARPHGVVRVGDEVLDLGHVAESVLLEGPAQTAAEAGARDSLGSLFALGPVPRRALRAALQDLLVDRGPTDGDTGRQAVLRAALRPVDEVEVLLPARIGDYTDFYVGIEHARNVGALFRPDAPLLPNYKWVPIAYHGRASTVRVSGSDVHRPAGQVLPTGASAPEFRPTEKLDFELELGVWIGSGVEAGRPVSIDRAEGHVAGYCLLNDWSARDIQAWEYQPLGPFLSKNFATTVSGWVVTPEALAPFRARVARPTADPRPLPHLATSVDGADDGAGDGAGGGLDITLEVLLSTAAMRRAGHAAARLSSSSTRHMYWSVAQMITHHTSNGCDLRPGDLLGSGTLSGPEPGAQGSLLELTRNGTTPIRLPSGELRTFLEDGDEVTLRARATRDGIGSVGFGDCVAVVQTAQNGA